MSRQYKNLQPPLKWVGGKRQLLPEIEKYFPKDFSRYYEPFFGGGAVLFHFQPKKAIINDFNEELVNYYNIIKNDVEALVLELSKKDKYRNNSDSFYKIRALDRTLDYKLFTDVERAARIQYLNKTCYNGLYRVNSKGEFNVPFGKYKKPEIVNAEVLREVSRYFNENDIRILNGDFEDAVKYIRKGAFVYFDPPYHPISETSSFTSYSSNGFDESEQIRLKNLCDRLDDRGVKFLLSNSASKFILDLYSDYEIVKIPARRSINSNGEKRGPVMEVLIRNYD